MFTDCMMVHFFCVTLYSTPGTLISELKPNGDATIATRQPLPRDFLHKRGLCRCKMTGEICSALLMSRLQWQRVYKHSLEGASYANMYFSASIRGRCRPHLTQCRNCQGQLSPSSCFTTIHWDQRPTITPRHQLYRTYAQHRADKHREGRSAVALAERQTLRCFIHRLISPMHRTDVYIDALNFQPMNGIKQHLGE